MSPLRVVDLFSGIGGFSLGLERTGGFETVLFCEISPKCRHLLNHHWPHVRCHDNVKTLTAQGVEAVDVLCGGFPCQDLSFAGRGAGLAGERSGLWSEYARLIGEFRPRFVIVENVSALVVRGLGTVLGDLAALGYDAWWDCIPASAVGAPHRRDRLWIVAYARSEQHQGFGDAFRRAVAAELARHTDYQSEPARAVDDETPRLPGMVANADEQQRWLEQQQQSGTRARPWDELGRGGADLADTTRIQSRWSFEWPERKRVGECGQQVSVRDANGPGLERQRTKPIGTSAQFSDTSDPSWWFSEPNVGRVANGVPARVDRLHGLGNAVVPQIPELIGRAILASVGALRSAENCSNDGIIPDHNTVDRTL